MLLYTHQRCLEHQMQPRHPESPDRLRAVLDHLERSGLLQRMTVRDATPVSEVRLARVHDADYLAALARLSPASGLAAVDADTYLCPKTLEAAALAAGAVADAVDAVLDGKARRAFCAVRPPGHHAEADMAMGFCFYNNVAVGAAMALERTDIERVAVLDFDVHHGNGTVDIFKDDPRVLVCSSFQHPFYPNRGYDVRRPNLVHTPLPAGCGSAAFRQAIEQDWRPALERHRPQLVLVSAGFDAHRLDPLGGLGLTEEDFRWVTRLIVDAAAATAGGRVVSTLEGGYDLTALAASVAAHLEVLAAE
ncbi:MAG: histone deacetylase family protein [Pseudomonadales bacterium]